MYTSFYNLSELPFTISTDPRFLWLGEKHQEALANLKYGLLEANGYVVLTGDVGTGKTTVLNALIRTLADSVLVANINHPTLDTVDFFNLVARTYDPSAEIACKTDFLVFLHTFLRKAHAEGKAVLLVIDEAHCLSKELLEEIRLLSNLEHKGAKLINVFFVGQNELKELLLCPQCRALRQRITLFYEIEPLSHNETLEYITHRLKVAGAGEQLFTAGAIGEIHTFSRGYPRLINIICGRAMMTGYVKEQKKIDKAIVVECAREISFLDPKPVSPAGLPDNFSSSPSHSIARPKRLVAPWKRKRYNLIPIGLAGIFALIVIAMGIRMQAESPLNDEAPARLARAELDRETGLPAGRAVAGMPQPPPDTIASIAARHVAEDPQKAPQTLAEDPPPAIKKEDAGVQSPPPLEKTPAVSTESPQGATTPSQLSQAPGADTFQRHLPTTMELAAAALEQKNYQVAIHLFETDRSGLTLTDHAAGETYSRALVGRAKQVMATSPAESETLLRKAVEVHPSNSEAHFNLGRIYTRSKEYALAIDAYQNAGTLNPQLSEAFFNLGFIYAITGMYEDAEKLFTRVVQLGPAYLDKALYNLAVIQEKLGKKEECLANLQMAVMTSPENQKAQEHLKRLLGATEESP